MSNILLESLQDLLENCSTLNVDKKPKIPQGKPDGREELTLLVGQLKDRVCESERKALEIQKRLNHLENQIEIPPRK